MCIRDRDGIRRVAVGSNDRSVLVGVHARDVLDLVERRLELATVLVDGIFIHHRVVHHQGQAVDEAFLGDGLELLDAGRICGGGGSRRCTGPFSYTPLRAPETVPDLVCRFSLEKKKNTVIGCMTPHTT